MGKQNLITLQLLAITGILSSILVAMIAFRQFVLPVGKADLSDVAAGVTPPYLRLVEDPQSTQSAQTIVNVFANTNGSPVHGIDVVLNYDAVTFPTPPEVRSLGALAVLQNTATVAGQLNFSLFSAPERGEPTLQTNADQEQAIAQLIFPPHQGTASLTQLNFVFTPAHLDETNMILYTPQRGEIPQDILMSAESLIFTLRK